MKKAFVLTVLLSSGAFGLGAADGPMLKYHDGTADGKRSLRGSGEILLFEAPAGDWMLKGIRIHGSRYGLPKAPEEDFYVFVMDAEAKDVLHTTTAPYAKFERGEAKWVEVKFKKPTEVPTKFAVALDFKAHQTKGVYVSFDTSTGGKHSRTGLPGAAPSQVDFGGDWMIEALMEKR